MVGVDSLASNGTVLFRVVPQISNAGKSREVKSPSPVTAFGSLGAKTRELYNDEFGGGFSQLVVAYSQLIQHPRAKILQDCIGFSGQFSDQSRTGWMLEIDRHGAHAEIAFDKPRRGIDIFVLPVVTKGIETTFFRFDLDDFSAITGQQSSRIGTGVPRGKGQDADTFEYLIWAVHGYLQFKMKNQKCKNNAIEARRVISFISPSFFNFEFCLP